MTKNKSNAQAAKDRIYKRICKELDKEHDGTCFITGEPIMYIEHHHLLGRAGEYMTDKNYIVCVAPNHKDWWHSTPLSELCLMPWWEGFLSRLKERSKEDRMYKKLYLKYSEL